MNQAAINPGKWGQRDWLLAALLVAAVFLTYSPLWHSGFINFDDNVYITQNPAVLAGLNRAGFRWDWTTTHAANWHPLTWLSLQLDAQLYGSEPWGYHLTNVLLHLANTLLVFAFLRRMTRAAVPSACVAALFAIHPLHVESVAWIAERKDVLSAFFGLVALWAYARYAEAPSLGRYLGVALAMVLSLLAKPMMVTLPAVLLLLDYWPLLRWRPHGGPGPQADPSQKPVPLRQLIVEKLPLVALAVASCIVTMWAQSRGGAVRSLAVLPLSSRLANALVSYAEYLRQMAAPVDLALLYLHPGVQLGTAMLAGAFLTVMTAVVLLWGRRYRYLPVGWFWYLGTLVPVIGLVQVGTQARADRYTYLPLIGIFVLLVWGLTDLTRRWHLLVRPKGRTIAGALVTSVFAYLILTAWTQAHYWQDSASIWAHTLDLMPDNWVAHNSMGTALLEQGDGETAEAHFREAVRLEPNAPQPRANLGAMMLEQGNMEEAEAQLRAALENDPQEPQRYAGLGAALTKLGRFPEAETVFRKALRLAPDDSQIRANLGIALMQQGKSAEATEQWRSIGLDSKAGQARSNIGVYLLSLGKLNEAESQLREALQVDPRLVKAHFNLGLVLLARHDAGRSLACFQRAVMLEPNNALYHRFLALALNEQGHAAQAQAEYRQALQLDPSWPEAATKKAWLLATSADPHRRNGRLAVLEAEQVRQAVGEPDPRALDALAAAYAEVGQFNEAAAMARQAQSRASAFGQMELVRQIGERLRLFEHNRPYHAD
jgi:Flp pilus assembly protein TadD